jgi:hypothetical protein
MLSNRSLAVFQYGFLIGLTVITAAACPLWTSLPVGALWALAIVGEATAV